MVKDHQIIALGLKRIVLKRRICLGIIFGFLPVTVASIRLGARFPIVPFIIEAAKAHGEMFLKIKPARTFVEVSRFIDPEWLVETEIDCVLREV
jgi:hypothetical protein